MARALSGLLVRHHREALTDGAGESAELEFNIPRGLAIEMWGANIQNIIIAHDGAETEVGTIFDIDGPSVANNAIATQATFEAREVLDSNLHGLHTRVDIITTGASMMSQQQYIPFPIPILTARNPGWIGFAIGSTGESRLTIYYRWVEITQAEFITLVADLRT